ncbi:MAG: glycosyltransferase, partial [Betaproteobacteria bacterium]|nr:glycosyltransferase [Betaproteobacteria bacterium]
MSESVRASLVVTTYNRPDALRLVLMSALCQTHLPEQIIVADDGSAAPTRHLIERFRLSSSVPIIHSWQEDLGFRAAASRNKA